LLKRREGSGKSRDIWKTILRLLGQRSQNNLVKRSIKLSIKAAGRGWLSHVMLMHDLSWRTDKGELTGQ
jgi:hypothetical protein